MRERIKDRDRLSHIIEAIDNILEFMDGKTENDLAHRQTAVLRRGEEH